METFARPSKTLKKVSFVRNLIASGLEIGGWCQSGNRFRFRLRCVCVCVRACEAVCGREAEVSFGEVSGRFRAGFGEVSGRFREGFGEVPRRFRGGFGEVSMCVVDMTSASASVKARCAPMILKTHPPISLSAVGWSYRYNEYTAEWPPCPWAQ